MKLTGQLGVIAGVLLLAGCNGGGSSDSPANTGTASFDVTDAPVDGVSTVKVTFDGIALKPKEGSQITIDFDTPVTIDNLLDLTGNASAPVLGDTTVEAGEYNYIRLFVVGGTPDSLVEEDNGQQFPLFIPGQQPQSQSQARRFLQLSSPFVVPVGGNADFTIDVELRKALTKPSGQNHYLLRPSLRLVNNAEVGTIEGTVDATLVNDPSCTNNTADDEGHSVYLYSAHDADIGDVNVDINGDGDHSSDDTDGVTPESNPLTLANVKFDSNTAEYRYQIGFVAAGDYTIAFTCQSLDDLPESDENIAFVGASNIQVSADSTTEHDFAASP